MEINSDIILEVKNLVTGFEVDNGVVLRAIEDISFTVKRGQTVGLVGESGCGKSVTSFSIMRLLPKPTGRIISGEILFHFKDDKTSKIEVIDIVKLDASRLHKIRGNRIAMIFQEPMTALNPVQTIYKQMAEVFELHFSEMTKDQIYTACVDLLIKVGIPSPETRLTEYPHQLSGGMRQRVMIAMALSCKPDVLIADEPTTALDVTIQAQILELIKNLQKETGMAVIFITHALGVIAQLCDDVVVMYAGKIVEKASVDQLFTNPKHCYTKGLLESIPKMDSKRKTRLKTIEGMVPPIGSFLAGCHFENRCLNAKERCKNELLDMQCVGKDHYVACWSAKKQG